MSVWVCVSVNAHIPAYSYEPESLSGACRKQGTRFALPAATPLPSVLPLWSAALVFTLLLYLSQKPKATERPDNIHTTSQNYLPVSFFQISDSLLKIQDRPRLCQRSCATSEFDFSFRPPSKYFSDLEITCNSLKTWYGVVHLTPSQKVLLRWHKPKFSVIKRRVLSYDFWNSIWNTNLKMHSLENWWNTT